MTCYEALFRARVRETAGPRYPSEDFDGATLGSPDLTTNASHLAQPWPPAAAAQATAPAVVPRSNIPSLGAAGLFFDAAQRANSGGSSDGPALVRADSSHATNHLACDGGQSCSSLRGLAAAQLDHERKAA